MHNLRQVVARWRWSVGIQRPFPKIADKQRQWLYHQLLHPWHHLAVKDTYYRGMQCDTPHEEQHQGTQKHTPCDVHRWMTEKNQSHRAIGRIPVSVLDLHYDFAAKTHRRDAECAENFKNERYVQRRMMRWNDSLWHLPLRTLHRYGDMPFLQWTPSCVDPDESRASSIKATTGHTAMIVDCERKRKSSPLVFCETLSVNTRHMVQWERKRCSGVRGAMQ